MYIVRAMNSTDQLHLHRYTDYESYLNCFSLSWEVRSTCCWSTPHLQWFSHWPSSQQLDVVQTAKSWWGWLGDVIGAIPAAVHYQNPLIPQDMGRGFPTGEISYTYHQIGWKDCCSRERRAWWFQVERRCWKCRKSGTSILRKEITGYYCYTAIWCGTKEF